MKIILNKCYGEFGISDEAMERLGLTELIELNEEKLRTNPELISAIESGENVSDDFSDLEVVTIPETTTDYYISKYDGLELLIYVVDGKLHWA